MSYATKLSKRHRRENRARQDRRFRGWAKSRRRRPRVLKRPPKWVRHAAKRDPVFAGLTWRVLGPGAMAGARRASGGTRP